MSNISISTKIYSLQSISLSLKTIYVCLDLFIHLFVYKITFLTYPTVTKSNPSSLWNQPLFISFIVNETTSTFIFILYEFILVIVFILCKFMTV